MTPEDQSRSDFEAWWRHEREQNSGHEIGADYRHWALLGWQASRRTYRASVLEEAAGVCEQMDAASMEEAKSRFLTDAGRSAYTSAAVGAANCAAAIRALAAKTQED